MNKRLQAILDLLQQSGSLTPEEKKSLADAVKESDKEITITEFKLERTEKVKRTTAILLEETIAELEQKRKSVEAQNRELEIEAALERVRSSAMAMHNSNDISATTSIVFTELQKLGTQSIRCGVGLLSNDSHMAQVYAATTSSYGEFHTLMRTISMTEHSSLAQQYETWLKQENYQTVLKGEDLKSYYNLPFFHSSASYTPPAHYDQKEYGYYFPFPEGLFYAWTVTPYSESELNILNRFKTIIALTFRRYLDLKKAEAQARESQVQLALERVRARTMAMQRSEELTDTAALLFQQIEELGIHQWGNSFQLWDDDMRAVTAWTCTQGLEVQKFRIPTTEDPVMINIVNAAQKGEILHVEEMGGEALEDHYKFMYSLPVFKKILDNLAATGITPPKFQVMYAAYFSSGYILFITHEPNPEAHDIFKRFSKVFEQTYTRFLDLQKAEAQAREAKIEAALEKVRSRSLAMHKSDELQEVVNSVFDRFKELEIETDTASIYIIKEGTKDLDCWLQTAEQTYSSGILFPYFDQSIMSRETLIRGEGYVSKTYTKNEKNEWFNLMFLHSDMRKIPETRKQFILDADAFTASRAHMKNTSINIFRYSAKEFTVSEYDVLKRFAKVFEQAYIRFLDLKKAEAQARESQIQLALERVRARTMAMQKSDELKDVAHELRVQLADLGTNELETCAINLYEEHDEFLEAWVAVRPPDSPKDISEFHFLLPKKGIYIIEDILEAYGSGVEEFVFELGGTKGVQWMNTMETLVPEMFAVAAAAPDFKNTGTVQAWFCCQYFSGGALIMITMTPPLEESRSLMKRCTQVFSLAYRRFADLKKAEAQAKEAQIEAALERVRSRSMGMQKSEELKEVIQVVYEQFVHVNIPIEHTGFIMDYKGRNDMQIWLADKHEVPSQVTIPYFDSPHWNSFNEAKEKGKDFFANKLTFEEKNRFYQKLFEFIPGLPEESKEYYLSCSGLAISTVLLDNVGLYIENFSGIPYSNEENATLMRFGKVFQQTYTRFLDLQKAEAQARESQIEAALERVRSRTMAMQHSDELLDVASILFQQVKALGVPQWNCGFNIWEIGDKEFTYYPGSPDGRISPSPCKIPLTEHPVFISFDESRKRGDELFVYEKEGEYQAGHYRYMLSLPGVGDLLQSMLDAGFQLPTFQIDHIVNFSRGNLIFITYQHFPEMHDIFKRFGKVFEQTYTRFLDLQKAEAQAREAQTEAALERVRSRTMAMQHSSELAEISFLLVKQVLGLGIKTWGCAFNIFDEDQPSSTEWFSNEQGYKSIYKTPREGVFLRYYEAAQRGESLHVEEFRDEACIEHYRYLSTLPGLDDEMKFYAEHGVPLPTSQFDNVTYFKYGYLLFVTYEDVPEAHDTFKRFAKVFEQTYTRFLDLQKAEAQAREAKIEVSLERVRSKAMAMHKSEDLSTAVAVVFDELDKLDLGMSRCGIGILNREKRTSDVWTTSKSEGQNRVHVSGDESMDIHPLLQKAFDAWLRQEDFSYILQGEDLADYYRALQHTNFRLPESQAMVKNAEMLQQHYYVATFPAGALFAFRENLFTDEAKNVMKRFANVFNLTYKRFQDIQKAEAQAREAQIEAALEKVRSRSLAMHKSDEVAFVVDELFLRLKDLEIGFDSVNILEFTEDAFQIWAAYQPGKFTVTKIPFSKSDIPYVRSAIEAKSKGLKLYTHQYLFEEKNLFLNYLFDETHFKNLPDERKQFLLQCPCYTVSIGFAKNTAIQLQSYSRAAFSESENNILKRFVNVFEQAYTRFLDLQTVEGQAREAQIQLALERVRARTMAMQHSNELRDAASVLFQQVKELGIDAWTCGFSIWDEDRKAPTAWLSRGVMQPPFKTPLTENQTLMHFYEAAQRGETLFVEEVSGETLTELYRYLGTLLVAEGVSDEIRKPGYAPPTFQVNHVAYFSYGYLLFITYKQYPEAHDIFKRFAKVFEQTYTRFLDLQKAEALARDAEIELSLERIRAKATSIRMSAELLDVIHKVFEEWKKLGLELYECNINLFDRETRMWTIWGSGVGEATLPQSYKIAFFDHPFPRQQYDDILNGVPYRSYLLEGEDYQRLLHHLFKETDFRHSPKEYQDALRSIDKIYSTLAYMKYGSMDVLTQEPLDNETGDILKRFVRVFEQAYTRYLDLVQAEAQAREAQIETALERVRSRTMAMHRSEEIADIVGKIFKELTSLDVALNRVLIWIFNSDEKYFTWWSANPEAESNAESYRVNYVDHPVFSTYFDAWQKKLPLLLYTLGDDLKVSWEDHLFKNTELTRLPKAVQDGMRSEKKIFTTSAIGEYGLLMAGGFEPFSDEANDIIQRFGRVFQQSYTRYVDVQKAEAQAREAQIEAALERTRTQSMLMQHSVQLDDTLRVFHEQVLLLGIKSAFSFLWLPDEKTDRHIFWAVWAENSSSEVKKDSTVFKSKAINYPLDRSEPATAQCLVDWKSDQPVHSYHVRPADVENYFAAWKELLDGVEKLKPEYFQDGLYYVEAFMKYGCFGVMLEGEMPEDEKKTLSRLAVEFERAYTRFLDLQKAEAQAREATIEASLEKVRGKAMAMHNSNDLTATASLVFTELRKLGIDSFRSGVGLLTKENRNIKLYSATSSEEGGSFSLVGWAVLDHHPVLSKSYDSWVINEDYYPVLKGETLKSYYENILATFTVPVEQSEGYEQYGYFLPFSEGLFYGWSEKPYTETDVKILHRFRGIVDLTFRRYMELEKSESIAKEAIRQASLDRVRAEIASMRTPADLDRITPLIWKELNILSIPFVRCGVFIMDDFQQQMHTFLSTPEGEAIGAFPLPYETPGNTGEILNHWRSKQMYISHWDETSFSDLGEQLVKQGAIPSKDVYMSTIPSEGIHLHCLPFLQGMLYVGNTTQLKEDDIHLIQSVADAFSTAYARYEDFNKLESAKVQIEKTLTDLKQTQNLLVQSEKMASLGELTAGIAHEIQNPLNFVNNFSEVSNELLEEMKEEIQKGNYEEVQTITDSVKKNLEKILHHGKRADGIVKGMLQHSRSSTGVKEPTDINALADEYLRLAYHGFRAKDKSFNASTNTDLDKSIGNINIVPQDIGRVVLNLITNAFYAVTEKQKHATAEYQPTVFLSTKRQDDYVLISVKDNGNGIPQNILDKIFQPFFTTKPTGQGTGLGLSLSYDILKAHGGEIRVKTKDGDGTEFIINLPYRYQ